MENYRLGVLAGDGIGHEIVSATVDVFRLAVQKLEMNIDWIDLPIGHDGIKLHNHPIPEETKDALLSCNGWIIGPHESTSYPKEYQSIRNPSGELRHTFDLYANVRPAKTLPGIKSMVGEADLVIYRENTEGFYPDRNLYRGYGEMQITSEIVVTTGIFTKKAISRIAHAACKMALQRRKKLTIVHKANVIKLGSGLFLGTCREVAREYPEIDVDDYHIDAMTAHLVRRMKDFDVIVTENMFGDILSDLAGELVGSLGLAPSINMNENQAMAQATHGSAPDIAGKNIANPIGIMMSTVMLMEWLGEKHSDPKLYELANLVRNGIYRTLENGIKTRDLNGSATTTVFTKEIMKNIQKAWAMEK
jgi:3-isopropylmalate dehydrogenase